MLANAKVQEKPALRGVANASVHKTHHIVVARQRRSTGECLRCKCSPAPKYKSNPAHVLPNARSTGNTCTWAVGNAKVQDRTCDARVHQRQSTGENLQHTLQVLADAEAQETLYDGCSPTPKYSENAFAQRARQRQRTRKTCTWRAREHLITGNATQRC